jgi:hypothetical protein
VGLYDVLGVRPDASAAELRRAYLELARQHHPDRAGGSPERMRALNEAWETLRDPERRRRYDLTLTGPAPRPVAGSDERDGLDGLDDLEGPDDLLDPDDRPIRGNVRLPSWYAVLPPGVLVLAVLVGLFGLVFRLAPVLAVAVGLGGVSAALFVLSPFVALAASRRR